MLREEELCGDCGPSALIELCPRLLSWPWAITPWHASPSSSPTAGSICWQIPHWVHLPVPCSFGGRQPCSHPVFPSSSQDRDSQFSPFSFLGCQFLIRIVEGKFYGWFSYLHNSLRFSRPLLLHPRHCLRGAPFSRCWACGRPEAG